MASAAMLTVALLAGESQAQQAATSAAGANAAPGPTEAASSNRVEEIVVTAEKRSENIQSVPLSIAAVSGATLEAAGVHDPLSLQKLVPNLQVNQSTFGAGVTIRIRGFGSAANSTTDSDVASYLDGAYIPRPGAILSSFLDVSNVEVLSGPQGMLFGRNAILGAISINTNAPSLTQKTASFTAEGGKYGEYSIGGVANLPVSDTFALRFAINGSHTDGVYHNELDNKQYGASDTVVERLSAKWQITPKLTWVLRLDGANTDGDGVQPATVDVNTATPGQVAALNTFVGLFHAPSLVDSVNPSYNINQVVKNPYLHDAQIGVTSDLNWDLTSNLTLRLIDSYRDWHDAQQTADTLSTTLDVISINERTNSQAQSHELQLISPKGAFLDSKLGFTAGIYYFHEDFGLTTGFNLGNQFCGLVYGFRAPQLVAPCSAGPLTNAAVSNITQRADSYAGYVQANYQLLPTVELDLGARETHDTKSAVLYSITPDKVGSAPLVAVEGPEGLSFRDTKPSYRATLSWHVTPSIMPFFTYSTGYKSGGFNSGPTSPPLGVAAREFRSETADDYEVGVKSVFLEHKVLLDVTLFDTELHNFQDRSFNGFNFLIRNSGDVRSRGADITGQFHPIPNLSFTYSATYLNSAYIIDTGAPGLEGCTGAKGSCPLVQNLSGRPLDYAPHWQGNGGVEYKLGTFFGGYKATIGGSAHTTSGFLTANTDNPQSKVPGYTTTDVRLSFFSPDGRWQVDLFGTNVFDEHYYVATVAQVLGGVIPGVNNTVTGATVFRGFLGDPSRWGVRLSGKF